MKNIISISKKFKCFVVLLLIASVFSSCEREMVDEIVSETPPELSVVVYTGTDMNTRVAAATVTLYATEEDRTSGQNPISSATTNTAGEANFAKANFRQGINYVSVTKDAKSALGATPYMLQNDGKTIFWVALN